MRVGQERGTVVGITFVGPGLENCCIQQRLRSRVRFRWNGCGMRFRHSLRPAKSGGGFWRPTGALAGRHSSEGPDRPGPIRASPEPTGAGLGPARRRGHAEVAGWSVYEVTPPRAQA
jgi:hypothetical protein